MAVSPAAAWAWPGTLMSRSRAAKAMAGSTTPHHGSRTSTPPRTGAWWLVCAGADKAASVKLGLLRHLEPYGIRARSHPVTHPFHPDTGPA
jgi:hypothetical protein